VLRRAAFLLISVTAMVGFGRPTATFPTSPHRVNVQKATGSFPSHFVPRSVRGEDTLALQQAAALPHSRSLPNRLVIPSVGLDAGLEVVGLEGHNIAVPRYYRNAGWYSGSARPGEPGSAFIDGHLDWYGPTPHSTVPAVFAQLAQVRVGDLIIVQTGDEWEVRFVVDFIGTVPYGTAPGEWISSGNPSLPSSLVLVTCNGTWDFGLGTYNTRLVVQATLAP
jgi:sortase (surface protein transpeptidase)